MARSKLMGRITVVVALAVIVSGTGAAVIAAAQTRDADPQTQALRELVAEVRALRAVIESYTAGQAQSQTLGDLLTVQQRRVAEATARLDVVRRELDGAVSEARRIGSDLERFESSLRQTPTAKQPEGVEDVVQQMKVELQRKVEQEQQLRVREAELSSAFGLEEAKWNELVDRLNQSLRR